MSALLPDRAWGTWDERFPACMMHVPSRLAVRVTMFSATQNRYEQFSAVPQTAFTLGEHASDSSYVELKLHSAGTTLGVEFAKPAWSDIVGRVRIIEPGEMLFRLSILLEFGFLAPARADAREQPEQLSDGIVRTLALGDRQSAAHRMRQSASARWRSQHFHAAVDPVPALSAQYRSTADLRDSLEHRGWLHHPQPAPQGDWIAMRFYGNPREPLHFAVSQQSDAAAARTAAETRLNTADASIDRLADATAREFAGGRISGRVEHPTAKPEDPAAGAEDRAAGAEAAAALKAVRDVLAWNTVWDEANHRPYTCASRAWTEGFGGWGVWMSDAFYAAMMCALINDTEGVRANLRAVLGAQQAAGNIPALSAADEEWVDRTQLPVAAFTTWRAYLLTDELALLRELYPALQRQLSWTISNRDGNGNGLYEYGSSPAGDAQGAQTKQGALNESGMDNMAIFDEAEYQLAAGTLDLEEPGHNSLIAQELMALAAIARRLGRADEAERHEARSRALAERIAERLWDPERELYAARRWDGSFAAHVSPTSFFPLLTGAVPEARSEAMLARHLFNEEQFWGPLPLPSAPFSDPVNREDSYWRGRIWAPLNYWVWEGLHRSGRHREARRLAARSWEMFAREWADGRRCRENYNSRDPAGHAAHDSDPFYTWGALIAFMWACENSRPKDSTAEQLWAGGPGGRPPAVEKLDLKSIEEDV